MAAEKYRSQIGRNLEDSEGGTIVFQQQLSTRYLVTFPAFDFRIVYYMRLLFQLQGQYCFLLTTNNVLSVHYMKLSFRRVLVENGRKKYNNYMNFDPRWHRGSADCWWSHSSGSEGEDQLRVAQEAPSPDQETNPPLAGRYRKVLQRCF